MSASNPVRSHLWLRDPESHNKKLFPLEADCTFFTLGYQIKTISCAGLSTENRADMSNSLFVRVSVDIQESTKMTHIIVFVTDKNEY